ncbi:methyltransferase domain-containing protein [Halobacillus litoralis]|uniref:class I SAM-dependent methyltransferase n=1 Tax=Halobacillus litoralis TaxID=45668 RepID=UPI001CD586CE|nr:class I SAM-dependent methyltransferase [Halobacillus litoralis]MCA0971005.1 methyltransferase domain-containing protein [Halobacillus litoralis]
MNEWITAMQARKWMKKNESFLPIWHAYVGVELDLFNQFERATDIDTVSEKTGYPRDLLASWVRVGVAVKHLKKRPNERFRSSKQRCSTLMGDNVSPGIKAILKEMLELHIPTMLKYPDIMRSHERAQFDHERHGEVVAETSALLEHFAIKKIIKMLRDQRAKTVVDLGCGHGGYLRKLSEEFPDLKLVGVDINQKVVDHARSLSEGYPNISFEVGDINTWEPEEQVDVVLLHNIFHYIHPDERDNLLDHLRSYVTHKGLISVITPISEKEYGHAFSSAFNSFFIAHDNLFALPDKQELQKISDHCHFEMFDLDPIIKEGSWYTFWLSPNSPIKEMRQSTMAGGTEQQIKREQAELTRTS